LSGKPSLLGAEQVTWKLRGDGLNVFAAGNGGGKTLLCSAVMAATLPNHTESLRHSLFKAGLLRVTVVGQLGPIKREWSLDTESGQVRQHSEQADSLGQYSPFTDLFLPVETMPEALPNFVLNGEWKAPEQELLDWAAEMTSVPLQREFDVWQRRLKSLTEGDGQSRLLNLHADVSRIEQQLLNSHALREKLRVAEEKSGELQERITDAELAANVSSEEKKDLDSKIELAERCVHLELWAAELRSSWNSVESARSQFAQLQERLEAVHSITRELGDNAEQLAQDYLRLSEARNTLAAQLRANEGKSAELSETISRLQKEISEMSASESPGPVTQPLYVRLAELEGISKDLSRTRIDLLRQRDGLEKQRTEKYGELAALGPDEWLALERYIDSDENDSDDRQQVDTGKQQAELERVNERLIKEFAEFFTLSTDTPARIEKLFALQEAVTARETELADLRRKVVELQIKGSGAGTKVIMSVLGAAVAGVPSGLTLGWDVGFFGAVIGGGAGYAIGRLTSPNYEEDADDHVRKIETLQHLQQSALSEREALRRDLQMFTMFSDRESALARWNEFVRLTERKQTLANMCERIVDAPADDPVPAVLRKLEREDIRRRVTDYRTLTANLTKANAALTSFDREDETHARSAEMELESQRLREEIATLERNEIETLNERKKRRQELTTSISRVESELAKTPDMEAVRQQLRDVISGMESLDESVGGAFSKLGANEILAAIRESDSLQAGLREAKAKLSAERSPQELSARTSMIEEELAQVTARIQELDPLFATIGSREEGLVKYREQMRELTAQAHASLELADRLSDEVGKLDLPGLQAQVQNFPSDQQLQNERASAQAKIEEIEKSMQAARSMCYVLTTELAEQRDQASESVLAIIQGVVFEAIGEKFASVAWSGSEWIMVMDDGQRRALKSQSRGVSELVALCLIAGLLSATSVAERAPIFWDDVLSQLDDHHLNISRQLIEQIAAKRQVVLLTRDPRIRDWGHPVEVLVGHVELKELVT